MDSHPDRTRPKLRRSHLWLLLQLHWRPLALMVIVGLLGVSYSAVALAWSSATGATTRPASASTFLAASSAVAASLSASSFWFAVAYIYSRGYLKTVEEYASLESFPIEKFIRASKRIEVNVHGWDGLFVGRGGDVSRPLMTQRGEIWQEFFKKDGTLVLMLPKLPEAATSHTERADLEQALRVVAKRNGKSFEEQVEEVKSTLRVAGIISGNGGVVDPRYCRQLRWICTIKFDDHSLLVSPYTQRHERAPFDAPALLINLYAYENTRAWVDLIHGREEREPAPADERNVPG